MDTEKVLIIDYLIQQWTLKQRFPLQEKLLENLEINNIENEKREDKI